MWAGTEKKQAPRWLPDAGQLGAPSRPFLRPRRPHLPGIRPSGELGAFLFKAQDPPLASVRGGNRNDGPPPTVPRRSPPRPPTPHHALRREVLCRPDGRGPARTSSSRK